MTILGLGRHGGGVAAARYYALAGAIVRVTDLADADALRESLDRLADVPIAKFTLGRHEEDDFRDADVVVVNPAVRPGNSFVELAQRTGAMITSEIELFLDACPAQVIGITGTVGKSTTASMLAAIMKESGKTTWLGGNIGHSLLAELPQISAHDVVVLELSSFQLHWLSERTHWPRGAVVTNCSPNHLDWHGSYENYMAAKRRLLAQFAGRWRGGAKPIRPKREAMGKVLRGSELPNEPPAFAAAKNFRRAQSGECRLRRGNGSGPWRF